MDEKYFPEKIEEKWQKRWSEERAFEASEDDPRPRFYALEMLPYPSGFLHMGHVRNYSIGDALAWYKRLRGFNVPSIMKPYDVNELMTVIARLASP